MMVDVVRPLGPLLSRADSPVARRVPIRLLLVITFLMSVGCGKSPNGETLEKLQDAEGLFTAATDEKQYGRSAQLFQQVAEEGFVSGKALYNQGNAYFKSHQLGPAIAAYRRALRYRPRDAHLIANLETALGKPLEQATRQTVWDYVFPWQRWLSYREKYQLTTVCLLGALGFLWYSRWYVPSVPVRRFAIAIGIIGVVFAGSSILDWYRIEHQRHGVLTQETTPRKGNSHNYAPAFTRPLADGTEFVVEERRGEWIRGRFADDAVGWLPAEMSIVY